MKNHVLLLIALGISCVLAPISNGQGMGAGKMGPGSGMDAALTKYFGTVKSFTAKANMQMKDKNQVTTMSMAMDFAMLEGKMKVEVDLSSAKGGKMPPDAAATMKQMGMDRVISISDPEKKVTCIIYPGLKSYAEMPMPPEQTAVLDNKTKVETTDLGKETIDGHPCVKSKVIVTDEKGEKHTALVWKASDLKDFPVQMEITQEDNIIAIQYKEIKMDKPDSALFAAPAGYTKYESVQTMMQGAMMKMMGGGR